MIYVVICHHYAPSIQFTDRRARSPHFTFFNGPHAWDCVRQNVTCLAALFSHLRYASFTSQSLKHNSRIANRGTPLSSAASRTLARLRRLDRLQPLNSTRYPNSIKRARDRKGEWTIASRGSCVRSVAHSAAPFCLSPLVPGTPASCYAGRGSGRAGHEEDVLGAFSGPSCLDPLFSQRISDS